MGKRLFLRCDYRPDDAERAFRAGERVEVLRQQKMPPNMPFGIRNRELVEVRFPDGSTRFISRDEADLIIGDKPEPPQFACPKCGCTKFRAYRLTHIWERCTINGRGELEDVGELGETEDSDEPKGPYSCDECGKTFDQLPAAVQEKRKPRRRHKEKGVA